MLILAIALLAANLLALIVLAVYYARTSGALKQLAEQAEALRPLHAELGPEMTRQLSDVGTRIIGIEILNPMEVAAKESWVAGQFGALAPSFIQREVYRQTRNILETQLREYGIEPRLHMFNGY